DVAQVVDNEQRNCKHSYGNRGADGQSREALGLHVRRADRGDEPEEDEDEELSEARIAVRARSAGVQPARGERRDADEQQPPVDRHRERQSGNTSDGEREQRRAAYRARRREPPADESYGPDAFRRIIGAALAVAVIVGEVGADLDRKRRDERGGGAPPDEL